MGANSAIRKVAKAILYPVANETSYAYFQAASKAWDIKRGSWSEPELDLLVPGILPGETALDLGANYGVYAYHMSIAAGAAGHVYSFEPIPFTFKSLKIVSKLLGFTKNVVLIDKGCGDANETVEFAVPTQASGAFAAGQAHIGDRDDDRDGKEDQVKWTGTKPVKAEIVRLDDFLPDLDNVSFIKADIEGAELFAFRGAARLITRFLPTVICEINPWFLKGYGIELGELTGFFFDIGYKLYFYNNDDGKRSLVEVDERDVVEDNYVFIHPSRSERFKGMMN
ncbi:MAG: FkbM family methyltransferase [Pyrinomonadaceae bacterium]